MSEHPPYVINPEAVGDPGQTPMVQLPPSIMAALNRMACPECDWINHSHAPGCSKAVAGDE